MLASDMMRSSMSGGYAVLLLLQLEVKEVVRLQKGDLLRLTVSGGESEDGVSHRVWHNPKWQSAFNVALDQAVEFKWAPAASADPPLTSDLVRCCL